MSCDSRAPGKVEGEGFFWDLLHGSGVMEKTVGSLRIDKEWGKPSHILPHTEPPVFLAFLGKVPV